MLCPVHRAGEAATGPLCRLYRDNQAHPLTHFHSVHNIPRILPLEVVDGRDAALQEERFNAIIPT